MAGRTARTSGLVLLVILTMAAAAAAGYVVTRGLRSDPAPRVRADVPAAYTSAGARPASSDAPSPAVDGAAVRVALASALSSAALGPRVGASVRDATDGTVLVDRRATSAAAPASVTKIATGAAVLSVHRPTDRIATTAVTDGRGTLVLIGGGDPTLSAASVGRSTRYAGAGRLSDLAAQVRRAAVPVRRIVVSGRFGGPTISPDWAPEDVPSEYGAAITALMTDGGRAAPGDTIRSATPDLDAGRSFAALLGRPGLPVARGGGPSGMRTIGTVSSAPYATLVEQMMLQSDDVIAECLARQVALARNAPATFAGAAAAMRAVLRQKLGVDIGAGLLDGSGLAPGDRLAPATITALLGVIASAPGEGPRDVITGLPVAGWSGTLAARFVTGSSRAAAGIVRAKTGTLTGVSTLAGYVHTRRGGLAAFAIFADGNTSTPAAQRALDAVAASLAACTC